MGIKEPVNLAILSFIPGMALLPGRRRLFCQGQSSGGCKDINRYASNYINQVGTFVP